MLGLQSLSDKDAWLGLPYDDRVEPLPDDPHFSISFGGEAFFVVGLHPTASRKARRFETPAMVFNLHDQFEQLRADGRYDVLRQRIGERDVRYWDRQIPCWRPTVKFPKPVSTVAVWSRTDGCARYYQKCSLLMIREIPSALGRCFHPRSRPTTYAYRLPKESRSQIFSPSAALI